MKLLVLALALATILVYIDAKMCRSSKDCRKNECCAKFSLALFERRRCYEMSKEGRYCSQEEKGSTDVYRIGCPCLDGLTCERYRVGFTLESNRCVNHNKYTTLKPTESVTETKPDPEPETSPEPKTDPELETEPSPDPKPDSSEPESETQEDFEPEF